LPRLLADPDGPEAAAILAALEEARQGGLRVGAIARDLSVFSRDGAETIGGVDVHAAVEAALTMTKHTTRARVVRDLGPVPAIRGSQGGLVQVLLNLLVNASHSMQGGGPDDQITVTTFLADGCSVPAPPIPHLAPLRSTSVDTQDTKARVVIAVRDTGVGIPPATIERIFDPFFSTKEVGMGTGLGLSISHGIVASFGGELRVESEVGRGTVFFVILPPWTEPSAT
jgi:signal transduction histidine kinase